MSAPGLPRDLPITVDSNIMSGTLVFRGTRVPVQTLFDYMADGYTLDAFLDSFPTVQRDDATRVLQIAGEYFVGGARNFATKRMVRKT